MQPSVFRPKLHPAAACLSLLALTITGCSTGASPLTGTSNTQVNVVLTSTANDQPTKYNLNFATLSLTNQSGQSATLITTASGQSPTAEFIHLNGSAEPFLTVTLPQGTYTSATATINTGSFGCYAFPSGSVPDFPTFSPATFPVTFTLPSPITITGSNATLLLDLIAAQSASVSSCAGYATNAYVAYSMSPTFTLTALNIAASPTTMLNGKLDNLKGEITSTSSSGFSVTLSDQSSATNLSVNSTTEYQGINALSALTTGTFVDVDAAIQSNGSLLATRVAVQDPAALNTTTGQAEIVDNLAGTPNVNLTYVLGQGPGAPAGSLPNVPPAPAYIGDYSYSSAVFKISSQFTNLQTLPFTPSFTAANMVAGQNIYSTSGAMSVAPVLGSTFTLMPQTIDGTITAISSSGSFTTYTVTLAPYNLFPALATQPGQTTLLTTPNQVTIYADTNTQLLNSTPLAIGNTARFNGLIFNDAGTLRMDCSEILSGVQQ